MTEPPVPGLPAVERWEWTFGPHERREDDLEVGGEVAPAVAGLTRWVEAWHDGVAALDDDAVLTVGRSQATPVDAAAPFGHLVLHLDRELVHHGSEVCALTDPYRSGMLRA